MKIRLRAYGSTFLPTKIIKTVFPQTKTAVVTALQTLHCPTLSLITRLYEFIIPNVNNVTMVIEIPWDLLVYPLWNLSMMNDEVFLIEWSRLASCEESMQHENLISFFNSAERIHFPAVGRCYQ